MYSERERKLRERSRVLKEQRAAIFGAFIHYLPIMFLSILCFSFVMILMYLWLQ